MSKIHKIVERLRENNQPISSKKCPPEITLKMLTKEMESIELDIMGDIGIDNLWYKYCQINYTTNIFGLYVTDENTEIDFEIIIEKNNNALPSKAQTSSRFNTLFSKAKPSSRFNPLFSRPKTSSRARPKSSSSARSKTSRVKIQEGGLNAGLISTIDGTYEYMKPKWTWNKLVKIDTARLDGYLGINGAPPLLLYGTSLPLIILNPGDRNVNSNNVINTFYTLSFYMFMKDIKQLISLHTCQPSGSQRSCNGVVVNNRNFAPPDNISPPDRTIDDPYYVRHQVLNPIPRIADGDYNSEERAWIGIKSSLHITANDNAITYTPCEITDMTCGSIDIWRQIGRFNFDVNKGIVHCAGGYGRTGSVLLYNILKRINTLYRRYPAINNIGFNIEDEFLGFTDSGNMYGGIQTLIRTFIVTDDNVIENGVYNADIVDNTVAANSQHAGTNNLVVLLNELTAQNNLLIQRLNNIILRIARHLQIVNPVYLYDIRPRGNLFVPIQITTTQVDQQARTALNYNDVYGLQF